MSPSQQVADPTPEPPPEPAERPVSSATPSSAPADPSEPAGSAGICRPGQLMWPGMQEGTKVFVSGGAYSVSTEDLDDFASTLTTAAQWLEDASVHAGAALAGVRDAVAGDQVSLGGSLAPGAGAQESSAAVSPATGIMPWAVAGAIHPAFYTLLNLAVSPLLTVPTAQPLTQLAFELRRLTAITQIETLTGSLDECAAALHDLASQVSAASETYGVAESAAGTTPTAISMWLSAARLLGYSPGWKTASSLLALAGVITRALGLTGPGLASEDQAAVVQNAQVLLQDADLADWVAEDLTVLVILAGLGARAQGPVSPTIEQYLAGIAEDIDEPISRKLPDQVQVGSRMVETSSLTPMQRVAYYLAMLSESTGEDWHGRRTGVTVTPRGGQGMTVPPGVEDPFGLGTTVTAMGAEDWRRGRTVTGGTFARSGHARSADSAGDPLTLDSVSGLIEYADSVKATDSDSGAISILRTTHEDGTNSWVVVIPGTSDWGVGSSNPQDQLTNFEAVSGRPTDMEAAVVTAMRQAGIQPGEPVGLYGHSQGGATAVNIASDPAIAEQFDITSVLTAGAPTAGAVLPSDVTAVHVEDVRDSVPALDGALTPRTTSRTVVTIDSNDSGIEGNPHGQSVYAQTTEGMAGHPSIDEYNEGLAALTGVGEDGAQTTEMIFDITRESAGVPDDPPVDPPTYPPGSYLPGAPLGQYYPYPANPSP
ncbi:hypothetical protein [Actinomyces howellii]|uniref:Alpha/beta hydrolase family n=1 Tax=Actinomyces howellii TaxID=52771 RepID=A0A3S4SNB1_9ACTO|nr:hypothetical protein [Actinomyces howellii]VEG28594.1 Uncharacterised protein [Actinomyces howellii]